MKILVLKKILSDFLFLNKKNRSFRHLETIDSRPGRQLWYKRQLILDVDDTLLWIDPVRRSYVARQIQQETWELMKKYVEERIHYTQWIFKHVIIPTQYPLLSLSEIKKSWNADKQERKEKQLYSQYDCQQKFCLEFPWWKETP